MLLSIIIIIITGDNRKPNYIRYIIIFRKAHCDCSDFNEQAILYLLKYCINNNEQTQLRNVAYSGHYYLLYKIMYFKMEIFEIYYRMKWVKRSWKQKTYYRTIPFGNLSFSKIANFGLPEYSDFSPSRVENVERKKMPNFPFAPMSSNVKGCCSYGRYIPWRAHGLVPLCIILLCVHQGYLPLLSCTPRFHRITVINQRGPKPERRAVTVWKSRVLKREKLRVQVLALTLYIYIEHLYTTYTGCLWSTRNILCDDLFRRDEN